MRPSVETISAMFGVSPERVCAQYRTNLQGLQDDLAKADNGRKVRGMDSRKIAECIDTIKSQIGA